MDNNDFLHQYVNSTLKYYQEISVGLLEVLTDTKPTNKKTTALIIKISNELVGYLHKVKEGLTICSGLGWKVVLDEDFAKILEKFEPLLSSDFFMDSEKNIILTDSGQLLKEFIKIVDSYKPENN